jgi:hypothetical protein
MPAEPQLFLALRSASAFAQASADRSRDVSSEAHSAKEDARSARLRSSSFGAFACKSSEAAEQRRRKTRAPSTLAKTLPGGGGGHD